MLVWLMALLLSSSFAALERIDIALLGLEEARELALKKKIPSFILEHLATVEVHGDPSSSLGTEVRLLGFPVKGKGRVLQIHLDSKGVRKNYLVDKSKEPNPKRSQTFLSQNTAEIAQGILKSLKFQKEKDVFSPFQAGFFGFSIGEEQDSRGKFLFFSADVYSETSPDILRYWRNKSGKHIADALIPGGPTTYPDEIEAESPFSGQ